MMRCLNKEMPTDQEFLDQLRMSLDSWVAPCKNSLVPYSDMVEYTLNTYLKDDTPLDRTIVLLRRSLKII